MKKVIRDTITLGTTLTFRRLFGLLKQPVFWFLTIIGHGWIAGGSYLFFRMENPTNPSVGSPLDAIYWAVSTVTTVGYGDIHPTAPEGKWVSIFMMVGGTVLFWSYTALFASTVLSPELQGVEKEIHDLEGDIDQVKKTISKK